MIAASKVIIGEPPETPSLFSPKLALFDGIAWRARSCVWKKKNWHGGSSSSSSSSGEGLRRRNVSSSVDKMKRIINDSLDDPTESPIKASDLVPMDISFPVGSEDYFTDFTTYEPVFYPNRRGRFRKWLLLGPLIALPIGASAGLIGALTQDYDGEDVIDDQADFDDCKPDQYEKIKRVTVSRNAIIASCFLCLYNGQH